MKPRQTPAKGGKKRLPLKGRPARVIAPARPPKTVPTRWLKIVFAIFLLPLCWVLSETFFVNFARVNASPRPFWASEEFWFFSLGAILWLIVFFGWRQPAPAVWLYVLGHEFTHALWVWASGGRVSAFRVTSEGGYIVSDTNNAAISLAPYFFPIYSLVVIAAWAGVGLCRPELWDHRWLLFCAVGATWSFHLSFTCWMVPKNQPDLLLHGTFFSLVVIYLANLSLLTGLLIISCPDVTWRGVGADFVENAARFSVWARSLAGL